MIQIRVYFPESYGITAPPRLEVRMGQAVVILHEKILEVAETIKYTIIS